MSSRDKISECKGSFVFDMALACSVEDDRDEVVGEDAGRPQDASEGALIVCIVLSQELL